LPAATEYTTPDAIELAIASSTAVLTPARLTLRFATAGLIALAVTQSSPSRRSVAVPVPAQSIPGVRLWHWPRELRPTESAKMHAKIAVADRHALLVSSVNLTESGVENNIEAGVIIRGGHAPQRFAEHNDELRAAGILTALR